MLPQAESQDRTLVVGTRPLKVLLLISAAFLFFVSFMAWRSGQGQTPVWVMVCVTLPLVVLVALSVYFMVMLGSVKMSSSFISYHCLWADYEIAWSEVEKIEVDIRSDILAFIGKDKTLLLIGPGFWQGRDKEQMLKLLAAQIEQRVIPVEAKRQSLLSASKNTKVL